MGSVNKVILVGNLGTDPDIRYTTKGTPVCHLSLATNATWKDSQGQQQSRTSWHRVVAWGKQGELCKEYLRKGRQIYVEGRLHNSSYEKNGETRWSTEVVSSSIVFLGRKNDGFYGSSSTDSQAHTSHASEPPPPLQEQDDDIPF
jgi:single-strand DNA-binding protein